MSRFTKTVAIGITLALVAALAYTFVLKRNFQHDLRRARLVSEFILSGSAIYVRACLCLPDEDVTLRRHDGLKVAASLHGTENTEGSPAIVLLHGNTPLGRKLPLYRVLATKLAEQGYLVMSIDFTGFGESDDPFELDSPEALTRDKDVHAALEYLTTERHLNRAQMYLVGHSGGAEAALRVGIEDDRVDGIVAIGPPRRTEERLRNPNDRKYFWNRAARTRKQLYDKDFPAWYTKELWIENRQKYHMGNYLSYFSQTGHKPVLFFDGELESPEDRLFLEAYFNRIAEPKRYVTIPNADHYTNTRGAMGLNVYDSSAVNQTVSEIDLWISEIGGRH